MGIASESLDMALGHGKELDMDPRGCVENHCSHRDDAGVRIWIHICVFTDGFRRFAPGSGQEVCLYGMS